MVVVTDLARWSALERQTWALFWQFCLQWTACRPARVVWIRNVHRSVKLLPAMMQMMSG